MSIRQIFISVISALFVSTIKSCRGEDRLMPASGRGYSPPATSGSPERQVFFFENQKSGAYVGSGLSHDGSADA
jgi:hypothetical protein